MFGTIHLGEIFHSLVITRYCVKGGWKESCSYCLHWLHPDEGNVEAQF